MTFPVDYWLAYQKPVKSLRGFVRLVTRIAEGWPDRRFVWRGVANASYALHSSLYRRVVAAGGGSEEDLRAAEDEVIAEARAWSLQRSPVDRLSALELLAALQHQAAPTRLLDFSHNALVALWFAVEQKYDDDGDPRPDTDGRVFVAQANSRETSPVWERDPEIPWRDPPTDWSRDIFVWTPPPIDGRIARQQGCFVMGGVPSTEGGWNRSPEGTGLLVQAEIRQCVSVPIRLNSPAQLDGPTVGRPPRYPLAFTFHVPAGSKSKLRCSFSEGLDTTTQCSIPTTPASRVSHGPSESSADASGMTRVPVWYRRARTQRHCA